MIRPGATLLTPRRALPTSLLLGYLALTSPHGRRITLFAANRRPPRKPPETETWTAALGEPILPARRYLACIVQAMRAPDGHKLAVFLPDAEAGRVERTPAPALLCRRQGGGPRNPFARVRGKKEAARW